MTGFAHAARELGGVALAWEIRSVNGKSLDVRVRLPPGGERLEPAVRQAIAKRFTRGHIQASLNWSRTKASVAQPIINEELLRDLAELAQRLQQQFGAAPARADGLLALRGVIEAPELAEGAEALAANDHEALSLLEEALAGLEATRAAEGQAIAGVLRTALDSIEAVIQRIESDPSRRPEAIRDRLAAQLRPLLDGSSGLDPDRLLVEAALLAAKADVREEIDRVLMHVAAARKMLDENGPVGRRLDFLAQEFNREANTLCSKSNAPSVTSAGLELKAIVDQFREQVQNLE